MDNKVLPQNNQVKELQALQYLGKNCVTVTEYSKSLCLHEDKMRNKTYTI